MSRKAVKLPQAREPVPDWWNDHFYRRQQSARTVLVRVLKQAGRAISQGELLGAAGGYGALEGKHALGTLVASGVVRRFVRHEPRTSAFKASLEVHSKMIDRTYYELT